MANFKIDDKTEKTALVNNDLVILGDSEDLLLTDKKLKKVKMSSQLTYMQNNLNFAGTTIKYLVNTDSPFTITDGDGYGKFICDTSSGNIVINLPTLSDNQNRELQFIHQTGGNLLTIDGESSEEIDGLTTVELPKGYDRMTILGTTSEWAMLEERISCQLRLDTYAGHGSSDTKIMQFTNSQEDYGNLFSHNHGSYGTAGLEITIEKSGKYNFSYCLSYSVGNNIFGFSLNSSQLTTNITSITAADILQYDRVDNAATQGGCSWEGYLDKNDIVRPHGVGSAVGQAFFTATYIGN